MILNSQSILVVALVLTGCASVKKSPELVEYETAHDARAGQQTKIRFPKLVGQAEAWHVAAVEAHDDAEKAEMDHFGRLAWLWFRAAQLRSDAQDAAAQSTALAEDVIALEQQLADAQKRERLAASSLERAKRMGALAGEIAAGEEGNAAREAIAAALGSLKAAQAVDADVHAASTFAAAEAKLTAANDALRRERPTDARQLALEALAGADAATKEATPRFASASSDQARLARDRALLDAVSRVGGTDPAMLEGGVVVTIVGAFSATGIDLLPAASATLRNVATVAREFPDYSLVVEGHTDGKGSKSKNLQTSEARAKGVVASLAAQGIAPDRMSALGKGGDEPLAQDKSKAGRAKNRRVEILFVHR